MIRPLLIVMYLLQITLVSSFTLKGYAQKNSVAMQYTISFPLGNTKDFVTRTSFRGLTLDYRYLLNQNWRLGGSIGWYTFFNETDVLTYTTSEGQSSLTGKQFRYVNSMPLLAFADYYFHSAQRITPFAGLGIGTIYNRKD